MPSQLLPILSLALLLAACQPVAGQQAPEAPIVLQGEPSAPTGVQEPAVANAVEGSAALPEGVNPDRVPAAPMSHRGADWLERDDRVAEEAPEQLYEQLGLQPGMIVADIGCGLGYHSAPIAQRVGPEGTVIGTEIQPEYRERFEARVQAAGVQNAEFRIVEAGTLGLDPESIDLALLVDVYHEISEPQAFLAELRTALRPGGRVALVEFRAEDPEVPILPDHKMSVVQVDWELAQAGYERVYRYDGLPWQHLLIYAPVAD
jgi:ubiquinone/menaquinone biosynthesis C-methylase UbiE